MTRHTHHFKIAFALAFSAGAWGIYWLPQRILVEGGLTGGWGTISQMIIGFLILWFLFISMTFIPFLMIFVEFFNITLDENKNSLILLIWSLLSCSWVLAALRSKQSIFLAILFPFAMLVTSIIGFYSVVSFLIDNIHWKNRNVIFQKGNKDK